MAQSQAGNNPDGTNDTPKELDDAVKMIFDYKPPLERDEPTGSSEGRKHRRFKGFKTLLRGRRRRASGVSKQP